MGRTRFVPCEGCRSGIWISNRKKHIERGICERRKILLEKGLAEILECGHFCAKPNRKRHRDVCKILKRQQLTQKILEERPRYRKITTTAETEDESATFNPWEMTLTVSADLLPDGIETRETTDEEKKELSALPSLHKTKRTEDLPTVPEVTARSQILDTISMFLNGIEKVTELAGFTRSATVSEVISAIDSI